MKQGIVCILIEPVFKVGDPAPEGYLEWHAWSKVQLRGGLRQRRCKTCGLFRFPQETCEHPAR